MNPVISWAQRKVAEQCATVAEARTVTKDFVRFSCREQFAGVTLTVLPADEFSLSFNVEPSLPDYRWAIEDAIWCALLSHRQPILRGCSNGRRHSRERLRFQLPFLQVCDIGSDG